MSLYEVGDYVLVFKGGQVVDGGEIEKVYPADDSAVYDVQGEEGFYAFVDESNLWRRKS